MPPTIRLFVAGVRVAAVTFLQSRFLATIGGYYTYRQTEGLMNYADEYGLRCHPDMHTKCLKYWSAIQTLVGVYADIQTAW
jgi:hypothetical protein